MTLPEALIFDVDGTLADTERDGHLPAFNRAFKDAGLDWHWEISEYGQLLEVSGGRERILSYIKNNNIKIKNIDNYDDFASDLHMAKNRHYSAALAAGKIRLRPGIWRLISEARQSGIRLAIATTSLRENVEDLLRTTLEQGTADLFEVLATANEVADKKPSPAVYDYVLDRLELTAADCLVFEDSQQGLWASRTLGLATIITVNEFTRHQDFTGALLVVDHLGDDEQAMRVLGGQARDIVDNHRKMIDLAVINEIFGTQGDG